MGRGGQGDGKRHYVDSPKNAASKAPLVVRSFWHKPKSTKPFVQLSPYTDGGGTLEPYFPTLPAHDGTILHRVNDLNSNPFEMSSVLQGWGATPDPPARRRPMGPSYWSPAAGCRTCSTRWPRPAPAGRVWCRCTWMSVRVLRWTSSRSPCPSTAPWVCASSDCPGTTARPRLRACWPRPARPQARGGGSDWAYQAATFIAKPTLPGLLTRHNAPRPILAFGCRSPESRLSGNMR